MLRSITGRFVLAGITALVLAGCTTPMATTQSPDGRTIEAPADAVVAMEAEWSRESQLETMSKITDQLLARPDSDGNVSAEGEAGHNWKQAMVARDLKEILGESSFNYFQMKASESRDWHQTARAGLFILAPPVLNRILYGEAGAVSQGGGGTYVKQNNSFGDGNTITAAGGPTGGDGAPGGEAAGGAGGAGDGGARGVQIGGVGNMQNAQDAYNGFQSRFREILHGEGCLGKQCQNTFGGTPAFGPVNDDDEGSLSLF